MAKRDVSNQKKPARAGEGIETSRGGGGQQGEGAGPVLLAIPACIWGLLFVAALWRLLLIVQLWLEPTLGVAQAAVVVHMPRLDLWVGWVILLIWWIGRDGQWGGLVPATLRQRRAATIGAVVAGAGVLLTAVSVAWDQFGDGGAAVGICADVALLLFGAGAILNELAQLARRTKSGITLMELWRLAAVQWVFAWMGAIGVTLYLRGTGRSAELARSTEIREILFLLPAVGLLPNVLMLVGLQGWNRVVFSPRAARAKQVQDKPGIAMPRVRAWLVALLMINVGGVLMALRTTPMLITGAALTLFGVINYLAGFPKNAWQGAGNAGRVLLGAWACFAIGLGLLVVDRLLGEAVAHAFFVEGGRHVLAAAVAGLWLIGMALAVRGRQRMGIVAAGALALGVVIVSGLLVLTAFRHGENQVPVLQGLIVGLILEWLGVLIAGTLFFERR